MRSETRGKGNAIHRKRIKAIITGVRPQLTLVLPPDIVEGAVNWWAKLTEHSIRY